MVMMKKKTGKWRLSVRDVHTMPRINYILDQLREARYINSLDLKDG